MIGCYNDEAKTILAYSNVWEHSGTLVFGHVLTSLTLLDSLCKPKITCYVLCWNLSDIPCWCWTCLPWWTWALPAVGDYKPGWGLLTCLNTILNINLKHDLSGWNMVGFWRWVVWVCMCVLVGYQNINQLHNFSCSRKHLINCAFWSLILQNLL